MHWIKRRIEESSGCVSRRIFSKGVAYLILLCDDPFYVDRKVLWSGQTYLLSTQDEARKFSKKFTPVKRGYANPEPIKEKACG